MIDRSFGETSRGAGLCQEVIEVVDEIKLPKILPSASALGRVTKVNRGESNTNEQRFDRRLREEQKNESDSRHEDTVDFKQRKQKQQELLNPDPGSYQDREDKNVKQDQGRLVDVVI